MSRSSPSTFPPDPEDHAALRATHRSGRKSVVLSFVLWQGAWFAAVGGAGAGMPLLGSIGALAIIALALAARRALRPEFGFVLTAMTLGYLVDSGLVLAGLLEFPESAKLLFPSTFWMALLWANLAAHLGPGSAFGWIDGRPGLALVIGATSGPIAYYGGMKLGAVTLVDPLPLVLGVLAVLWGIAFPLLYPLRRAIRPERTEPAEGAPS